MIVTIPADPSRTYALAAYWPGTSLCYYSWPIGQWVACQDPSCLLPFTVDPASVAGDILIATVPDAIASAEVILQLLTLGPDGQPVGTADCEVLLP